MLKSPLTSVLNIFLTNLKINKRQRVYLLKKRSCIFFRNIYDFHIRKKFETISWILLPPITISLKSFKSLVIIFFSNYLFRYLFGSDVVAQFNQANDVDMICRAHQLVMEGYKWHFNETVLTVWSAPNYCYRCGNVAAILELDEHLGRSFTIFEAVPQEARGPGSV